MSLERLAWHLGLTYSPSLRTIGRRGGYSRFGAWIRRIR